MSVRTDIQTRKSELNGLGVKQFPANLGAHATLLIFKKYKYRSPGTIGLNRISDSTLSREELGSSSLLLPLPNEIKDSYSISISAFSQGMFGDAISQGGNYMLGDGSIDMNKIMENVGIPSAQNMVTIASGAMVGLASKFLGSKTGFVGGAALGSLLPSEGAVATSLEAGAGAISNPKQALSFQGIGLKDHKFSWRMAPSSQDESDTIRDITNVVRKNALPSYTNLGGLKRAILNYPSTVDIYFFGIEQSYFMYYKTCMIDNFEFNYTPQGVAVMRGGKPAVVDMSISLKEMDIHTAEDYGGEGGGNLLVSDTSLNTKIGPQ